jgi:hypothetical protein
LPEADEVTVQGASGQAFYLTRVSVFKMDFQFVHWNCRSSRVQHGVTIGADRPEIIDRINFVFGTYRRDFHDVVDGE